MTPNAPREDGNEILQRKWRTVDRDPEPGFKDWTYLQLCGREAIRTVHVFDDCLDYRLTKYLNEYPETADLPVEEVVKAYLEFDQRGAVLTADLERAQERLRLEFNERMKNNAIAIIENLIQTCGSSSSTIGR